MRPLRSLAAVAFLFYAPVAARAERVGDLFVRAAEQAVRMLDVDLRSASVSVVPEVIERESVVISRMDGETEEVPFGRSVLVFVDDHPKANWSHPCRYVYFNEGLTAHRVCLRRYRPEPRRSSGEEIVLRRVAGVKDSLSFGKTVRSVRAFAKAAAAVPAPAGDVARSHVLLISGGANPANNGLRFWADTAMLYSTLVRQYAVPRENVTVLVSDGGADGKDATAYVLDDDGEEVQRRVSSPADLDGDGRPDIDGPASFAGVSAAFEALKGKLTKDDQLFVFITSHGDSIGEEGEDNRNCFAWLYSSKSSVREILRDDQLQDLTKDIPCPVAFAFETCYSGGFVDDLMQSADRVVATACNHHELSWGWEGYLWEEGNEGAISSFNFWALPFTSALRGRVPLSAESAEAYPWQDGTDVRTSADANGDGRVSFREAVEFARLNDAYAQAGADPCEHPQFAESTRGLGDRFFLQGPLDIEMLTFSSAGGGTVSVPKWYVDGLMQRPEASGYESFDPNADWDADGMTNYAEYISGTDPFDRDDVLLIRGVSSGEGSLRLRLCCQAGRRYGVQAAEVISREAWSDVQFQVDAAGNPLWNYVLPLSENARKREIDLILPVSPKGFYRIKVERGGDYPP